MTVVVSHFSNRTNTFGGLLGWGAGQLGVMLFFTLSGYLIGTLYLDRAFTPQNLGVFCRRRIARVVPLYLIVVGLSLLAWAIFGAGSWLYQVNLTNLWAHLLFWRGIDVLWTIPVEIQFYAVFPLVWFAFPKRKEAIWVLLALACAVVPLAGFPDTPALLPHVSFFAMGLAMSRCTTPLRLDAAFVAALILYVLCFPGVRTALWPPVGNVVFQPVWQSPIYMIVVPALLFSSLHSRLADVLFANAVARYLGRISYSIYLLHLPTLLALSKSTSLGDNNAVFFVVFVAMTILVSTASYFLCEAPLRRLINGST